MDLSFYNNKKVFITGHTGFKGSWMCQILKNIGANVTGYALQPEKDGLYELLELDKYVDSRIGDIRDIEHLTSVVNEVKPEIVIHMAAQPLVRYSYECPRETFETNVMGTVNVLEAIRNCKSVKSFVNVTTDKVYQNVEQEEGYVEEDVLCGLDPYSNSKSCSELVTFSYKQSFFKDKDCAISTCRAGNVIGGGDFAKDRIIPDCVKAAMEGETIGIRNPLSVRPFQHVLEPVTCYLYLAMKQHEDTRFAGNYNIGPKDESCVTGGEIATLFCKYWQGAKWAHVGENNPVHEANFLRLNSSKIQKILNWEDRWDVEKAVEKTVEWYYAYSMKENMEYITNQQIAEYQQDKE